MSKQHLRLHRLDRSPRRNNDRPSPQGAQWNSSPKPSKTRPPPAQRSGLISQSRITEPHSPGVEQVPHGRSQHKPTKHAGFSRTHQPSRVGKQRMPDDRSNVGPNKRRVQFSEPTLRTPSLMSRKRRDIEARLDDIVRNHKFESVDNMARDHRLECLEELISSHKFESVDDMIRDHEREFESQKQGYQSPIVEDDADATPEHQNNGMRLPSTSPTLKKTNIRVTAENVDISPGTLPAKTVHWAENVTGPSGTGQPGSKVPIKSALTQHISHPNKDTIDQPQWKCPWENSHETHEALAEAKVPTLILQPISSPGTPKPSPSSVPLHSLVSDEPSKSKESAIGGDSSVQPTKHPASPTSPPRSSRFQDIKSPHLPSQIPPSRPSQASGVASTQPIKPLTPPTSPRRSPRLQQSQSCSTDPQPILEYQSTPASLAHTPPQIATIQLVDPSLSQPIVQAELDYLRSEQFDPSLIRPVPNLSQVFESMASAFGEPGTGVLQTRFAPPSPQHSTSGAGSVELTARKQDKSRRYTINPTLKSRHLDIELLRVRVSHAMLLSFNLAPDARRDAVNIGDLAQFSIGPGVDLPGRSLFRGSDLKFRDTSGVGKSKREKEHVGTGVLSGRRGNRRRNSNKDTWIVVDGHRKRRRESDGDTEPIERERKINLNKKLARAAEEGDTKTLKQISWESSGSSTRSAATGTMNVMFWRFIRVSALVEVDVKVSGRVGVEKMEETQSAWWAVPERAIVGMF